MLRREPLVLAGGCAFGRDDLGGAGGFQKLKCSHDASAVGAPWLKDWGLANRMLFRLRQGAKQR